MKKIFLVAFTASLMGVSLFAGNIVGKVNLIKHKSDGSVLIEVQKADTSLVRLPINNTYKQEMLATALTAFTANLDVVLLKDGSEWTEIALTK